MRGVTLGAVDYMFTDDISTHTPHARRDFIFQVKNLLTIISTHTPHARRDRVVFQLELSGVTFQLTRLMRGVTRDNTQHEQAY